MIKTICKIYIFCECWEHKKGGKLLPWKWETILNFIFNQNCLCPGNRTNSISTHFNSYFSLSISHSLTFIWGKIFLSWGESMVQSGGKLKVMVFESLDHPSSIRNHYWTDRDEGKSKESLSRGWSGIFTDSDIETSFLTFITTQVHSTLSCYQMSLNNYEEDSALTAEMIMLSSCYSQWQAGICRISHDHVELWYCHKLTQVWLQQYIIKLISEDICY